jgi:hypothetical protein
MGYPELEFINAYRNNIAKQNQQVIDTDPFAKAISLLFNELFTEENSNIKAEFKHNAKLNSYSISAFGYLEELKRIAYRHGLDVSDNWFPKAANALSYRLNIVKTNLRSKGIEVIIRESRTKEDRDNGFAKNTTIVEMKSVSCGNDGNDGNHVCTLAYERKIEEDCQKEGLTKTVTIPTMVTKSYSLMLVYKVPVRQ